MVATLQEILKDLHPAQPGPPGAAAGDISKSCTPSSSSGPNQPTGLGNLPAIENSYTWTRQELQNGDPVLCRAIEDQAMPYPPGHMQASSQALNPKLCFVFRLLHYCRRSPPSPSPLSPLCLSMSAPPG